MVRRFFQICSLVLVAQLFATVVLAQQVRRDSADFELGRAVEILSNIMYEFDTKYVGKVDVDKLLSSAVYGMTRSTDPYSQYLSEKDMKQLGI